MSNNTFDEVVCRVIRQHNSLLITVPRLLRRDLELKPGDYVVYRKKRGDKHAIMFKLHGGYEHEREAVKRAGRKAQG